MRALVALIVVVLFGAFLPLSATSAGAQASDCTVTRSGDDNVINWQRGDGTNVIRRNGDWLATPDDGVSTYRDSNAPSGASYVIRTRPGGNIDDVSCTQGGAPAAGCTIDRVGSNNVVSWDDDGGFHVIRLNGDWLSTPGNGQSSFVHNGGPANGTYVVRTFSGNSSTDRSCSAGGGGGGGPIGDGPCTVSRNGSDNLISWTDGGGTNVLRRNGDWLTTPGPGVSSFLDRDASSSANYELRVFTAAGRQDIACVQGNGGTTPVDGDRQFVVHISVDGLRSDFVSAQITPNLFRLAEEGTFTLNARTDPDETRTLPNHTSQFTGRFVNGSNGHGVNFNNDIPGVTAHDTAGEYVSSVFDVVHDNGGRTVLYNGKDKFDLHERSWIRSGANDVIGANDGTEKIDVFVKDNPLTSYGDFIDDLVAGSGDTFGFFHIREPDSAGHQHNWGSIEYRTGVTTGDQTIGQLIDGLEFAGVLDQTTIIVTSDHGGPNGQDLHNTPDVPEAYIVPFVVWGDGVRAGTDLYQLNPTSRTDPGQDQIGRGGDQPIRGHDAANLALDILGLPAIPDSDVNDRQDLDIN